MAPMSADPRIARHLRSFLSGKITLRQFGEWFVPQAWEIELREAPGVAALARKVELRIAEHSSGHRTDADLRARLEELVPAPRKRAAAR